MRVGEGIVESLSCIGSRWSWKGCWGVNYG